MACPNKPNCGFPNWPTEVIQKVASNFTTPSQLLNYACICKRANSAIGLREYLINDIQYFQTSRRSEWASFVWRHGIVSQYSRLEPPTRSGNQDAFKRPYLQMKPPGSCVPLINWAIETGVDINLIKEIVDIYSRLYPRALEGLRHPMHCTGNRMDDILHDYLEYRDFPSPMLVAAKSGRLDVIKTLLESGVEIRKQNFTERITRYHLYESAGAGMDVRDEMDDDFMCATAEVDAFSLACEADEEIAQFMLRNGLDLRYRDLWWPVEFGRMQLLETLLQHPLFKTDDGQEAIVQVLHCIARQGDTHPIRDFSVIKRLLDATTIPPLDKTNLLETLTARALRSGRSPYKSALSWHLFDLFRNSGPQSLISFEIARQAARSDDFLEITRAILLDVEHSKKANGNKEISWIDHIMKQASERICPRTAECLLSFGYKFSSIRLQQAVCGTSFRGPCDSLAYTAQLDLIDIIVNSGISVGSIRVQSRLGGLTLLEEALRHSRIIKTEDDRWRLDCLVALRLMHHGADPTEVGEKTLEYWLEPELYMDGDLTNYFFYRIHDPNDSANPGREIFSHKVSSVDSPLYFEQVYTMAVMMKGKDFLESLLTKWRVYQETWAERKRYSFSWD
ncbi:hypothetical protein F5Y00DRAFT_273528 [Daldinia vernicosa]|uniref:uncharacterized protein n=1 Tax=Daldinia vernicosa TaxID=114800 RepID=UPI002007E54B|nr:uncharacterized protein F5Y00DRAFT_273528 [Daldinia vernicosa]KAI0844852.1 hypothetical protein F5Y00DRAFT_273528 [Daldinia vernicosa]